MSVEVSEGFTFLLLHFLDLSRGGRLLFNLGGDNLFLASALRSCGFGFGFRWLLLAGRLSGRCFRRSQLELGCCLGSLRRLNLIS